MRRIVRISENDLKNIILKKIQEQGNMFATAGTPVSTPQNKKPVETQDKKYPCVADILQPFVSYVLKNKKQLSNKLGIDEKLLIILTKASIGIIGRESTYGRYTTKSDEVSEFLRSNGLGGLVDVGIGLYNVGRNIRGKKKVDQSLGIAQFTPDTWKRYDLDKLVGPYNESFTSINQGLGVLFKLASEYKKGLSLGFDSTIPSQNQILQKNGIINKINGTGNNVLDLAILTHNMPSQKVLTKYCTTNHPLYAAPCKLSIYEPFKTQESFDQHSKTSQTLKKSNVDPKFKKFPGKLRVNRGEILPGYVPNLSGPNHSAIGYIEFVSKIFRSLNCF